MIPQDRPITRPQSIHMSKCSAADYMLTNKYAATINHYAAIARNRLFQMPLPETHSICSIEGIHLVSPYKINHLPLHNNKIRSYSPSTRVPHCIVPENSTIVRS